MPDQENRVSNKEIEELNRAMSFKSEKNMLASRADELQIPSFSFKNS